MATTTDQRTGNPTKVGAYANRAIIASASRASCSCTTNPPTARAAAT
jgi:hypothetical protein